MTFKSYQKIFNWVGQPKNSCIHFQIECIQLEIPLLCLFLIFIIWINHHTQRKSRIFMNNRDLRGDSVPSIGNPLQTVILHPI